MSKAVGLSVFIFALFGCEAARTGALTDSRSRVEGTDYMRLVERDRARRVGRVDTAVVRHFDDRGRRVDLVSMLHVGERDYYSSLRERLVEYDAVLFEMVVPSRDVSFDPVSLRSSGAVARQLAAELGLECQLDNIDYLASNFVHADLTLSEIQQATGIDLGKRVASLRREGVDDLLLPDSVFVAESERRVRRVDSFEYDGTRNEHAADAERDVRGSAMRLPPPPSRRSDLFANARSMMRAIIARAEQRAVRDENGLEVAVVGARNAQVLDVLERRLASGDRTIAVLYGAGHMPGLGHALLRRGFTAQSREWLTAWRIE